MESYAGSIARSRRQVHIETIAYGWNGAVGNVLSAFQPTRGTFIALLICNPPPDTQILSNIILNRDHTTFNQHLTNRHVQHFNQFVHIFQNIGCVFNQQSVGSFVHGNCATFGQ